jgi:hypothetical protein
MEWPIVALAVLMTFGTSIVFGVLPALYASRPNLTEVLKEESRGSSGQAQIELKGADGAKRVFAGAARNRQCDGAAAQHRRHLWCARLCRHAAPARGWNPRRARRGATHRERLVRLSRDDSLEHRHRR